MNKPKMKGCPLCGRQPVEYRAVPRGEMARLVCYPHGRDHYLSVEAPTLAEARERWNRRAGE